jgi:hypothetical protein
MLRGKLAKFRGKIAYLVDYHPYRLPGGTGRNPDADENTYRIMDVKCDQAEKRNKAAKGFFAELDPLVATGVAVAVVPSHDPGKLTTGIRLIAQEIAKRAERIDATACLVRHTKVEKKSGGGDRSMTVDLKSIRAENPDVTKDQRVLLIDDVTTSGRSLEACKQILLRAGAKEVQCLALGRTVR